MKQFWELVSKEWRHIRRDTKTLVILFGMPIAQMLIFGFALTNEVKNSGIAILDPSRDAMSQRLIHRFHASRYFDIRQNLKSPADIDPALRSGRVRMAIVFPENFETRARQDGFMTIQLIADASDPNTATTMVNYAQALIQDFQSEVTGSANKPQGIRTELRMLYNPQLEGAYNFVPGVMAMILLLVCTMMTSVSIVREKELGTMEILLVSPVRPMRIILAKAVPYLLLSVVNICTILLLSFFVLGLPIRGSLLLLFSGSILFIVTSLSLGLLISTVTTEQRTAMFISLVGMFLPTLMLSGFMFPIENMPVPLQVISHVVPARWYFQMVQAVMLKGLGLQAIWKETLILCLMTLFLLTLALKKFKIRL